MNQQEITRRLRRVEGQIRGLQRMIEEERECEAVITQLMAARAALDKIGVYVVNDYVEKCLNNPDLETARQRIGRTMELILKLSPNLTPATSIESAPHNQEQERS
jgi:DNA-binding FrmR family transcriptional regulator